MTSIFFSYSHKDEELRDRLQVQLTALQRQGHINSWHDRHIDVGSDVAKTIDTHLEGADVILLLVSPDFIASDYCYEIEMKRAMERHESGEAIVIPIILRACDWKNAPFGKLLAAPTDGKPIKQWADLDEAFLNVVQAIKKAIKPKAGATGMTAPIAQQTPPTSSALQSSEIRSSNLAITREYSESERDSFLHDAFSYIATYFENSLKELQNRNPVIEGRFRQIDANRFTSVIYKAGTAISHCTVFIKGDMGNSIGYSNSDNGSTNSYNESLSVENDGQGLYLQPMGMSFSHQYDRNAKLTQQGGAELLWGMLIAPLQVKSY